VLKDGLLQQVGTPRECDDRPINVFVAGFIGSPAMNLLELPTSEDGSSSATDLPVPAEGAGQGQGQGDPRCCGGGLELSDHGIAVFVEVVEEARRRRLRRRHPEDRRRRHPIIARVDGRKPPEKGTT